MPRCRLRRPEPLQSLPRKERLQIKMDPGTQARGDVDSIHAEGDAQETHEHARGAAHARSARSRRLQTLARQLKEVCTHWAFFSSSNMFIVVFSLLVEGREWDGPRGALIGVFARGRAEVLRIPAAAHARRELRQVREGLVCRARAARETRRIERGGERRCGGERSHLREGAACVERRVVAVRRGRVRGDRRRRARPRGPVAGALRDKLGFGEEGGLSFEGGRARGARFVPASEVDAEFTKGGAYGCHNGVIASGGAARGC
mmetsp:Transcript_18756/g.61248  ORF Transcript_18756/g.61248 Transcript_18756/m.61248 type:complete len:261 (-) Transcript_18756:327-1109(-)